MALSHTFHVRHFWINISQALHSCTLKTRLSPLIFQRQGSTRTLPLPNLYCWKIKGESLSPSFEAIHSVRYSLSSFLCLCSPCCLQGILLETLSAVHHLPQGTPGAVPLLDRLPPLLLQFLHHQLSGVCARTAILFVQWNPSCNSIRTLQQ